MAVLLVASESGGPVALLGVNSVSGLRRKRIASPGGGNLGNKAVGVRSKAGHLVPGGVDYWCGYRVVVLVGIGFAGLNTESLLSVACFENRIFVGLSLGIWVDILRLLAPAYCGCHLACGCSERVF